MEESSKNVKVLFDNILLKDDKIHYPDDQVAWLDCFPIGNLVFGVINETDQILTVQPIGRAGGALGSLGSATSVAANSESIVCLGLQTYWSPYISVSIKAASEPSSGGRVTVYVIWRNR